MVSEDRFKLIEFPDAARQMGLLRVVIFGSWIGMVLMDRLPSLSAVPLTVYEPIGWLNLIPSAFQPFLMSEPFLILLQWSIILVCGYVALGLKPYRPMIVLACVLLTYYQTMVRGYGLVNHKELPMLFAAYVLAIFPSDDAIYIGKKREAQSPQVYQSGLMLILLIMLLAYSAIAIHRVARSAPEIFLGDSMRYYIGMTTFRSENFGTGISEWVLSWKYGAPFLNAGYFVTTIFEIFSPVCLIHRGFRFVWVPVILAFHVATLVLMNILFWQNMVLIVLLLTYIPAYFIIYLDHRILEKQKGGA